MTPQRAREIGLKRQDDGTWTKTLYTVYIGGKAEHRNHWAKYSPDCEYGFYEAVAHAKDAKNYLSTNGQRVKVFKETTVVTEVFSL